MQIKNFNRQNTSAETGMGMQSRTKILEHRPAVRYRTSANGKQKGFPCMVLRYYPTMRIILPSIFGYFFCDEKSNINLKCNSKENNKVLNTVKTRGLDTSAIIQKDALQPIAHTLFSTSK